MIETKIYKDDMKNYTECAIWCHKNNATIVDKGEYYEVVEIEPYQPTKDDEILRLKEELATYDYIGIKIATGVATIEDYAKQIAYAESLRIKIRELEGDIV